MAYDTEKKLEDLILRAIRQVLAEQLPAKRRLYVVFADAFDCRCVNFLRSLSPADDVTVLVDEIQAEQVRCDIEQACPLCVCRPHLAGPFLAVNRQSDRLSGGFTGFRRQGGPGTG